MEATYNWVIESVYAKKVFTDKNNNIRENVIKVINLLYLGTLNEREEKERAIVNLDLFNLSEFKPIEDLSKEQILDWALTNLNSKEKERIEKSVKNRLEGLEEPNLVKIFL